MVAKIGATVEARDQRISEDLASAERARAEADETEEAYRAELERNRAEALKVTQAAKQASARETERMIKGADSEIGQKTETAEAQIRAAANAALAEIETVAAEAAQEMVAKLSGRKVSRDQAAAAVRDALKAGAAAHG
jgi:F-type H+-transporting ATPase subunit b